MSIISEACDKWFEAEEEAGHYPYDAAPSTIFLAGWHAALHETGLLEAVEAALAIIKDECEGETYGAPLCDDPRDFQQDEDACTPEEIAAWRAACGRAEKGEAVNVPRHQWVSGEDGKAVAHVSNEPWGIGISKYRIPEMCELRDKLQAAIRKAKGG